MRFLRFLWWLILLCLGLGKVRLEIQLTKVIIMLEGATFLFKVVAKNAAGREVPDAGVTVSVDNPALGTLTFDSATQSGSFVAGTTDGTATLAATDGTLNAAPFPVVIQADQTPATLEIVAV
jgi:hypothetical protein